MSHGLSGEPEGKLAMKLLGLGTKMRFILKRRYADSINALRSRSLLNEPSSKGPIDVVTKIAEVQAAGASRKRNEKRSLAKDHQLGNLVGRAYPYISA